MHIHILGISGTFMSALAILAKEAGFTVTGSDLNCYPPVSDLLKAKDIKWVEGYEDSELALKADQVIVGNAIKRGMPVMEAVLRAGKSYTSGPQWLADNILSSYKVIAIAGTHGKTTTTAMITWILKYAGFDPGFLIGGVSQNLNTSAALGKGDFFVVEADEYDSAFFDKRPKFMHYRPEIAILNNLEFDHADIYSDLAAIQQQFHYLLRTIPPQGFVLKPKNDSALNAVIEKGLYSKMEELAINEKADWQAELLEESGNAFKIYYKEECLATIHWPLIGRFNIENALAAFAACRHAGVKAEVIAEALSKFKPVKRRLEVRYNQNGITVYDDFAHHPTAFAKTIAALKESQRHKRVFVIMEFASYTMRTGVHKNTIGDALKAADAVYVLKPQDFSLDNLNCHILPSVEEIIAKIVPTLQPEDAVLIMSNRGFENIHERLIAKL